MAGSSASTDMAGLVKTIEQVHSKPMIRFITSLTYFHLLLIYKGESTIYYIFHNLF